MGQIWSQIEKLAIACGDPVPAPVCAALPAAALSDTAASPISRVKLDLLPPPAPEDPAPAPEAPRLALKDGPPAQLAPLPAKPQIRTPREFSRSLLLRSQPHVLG